MLGGPNNDPSRLTLNAIGARYPVVRPDAGCSQLPLNLLSAVAAGIIVRPLYWCAPVEDWQRYTDSAGLHLANLTFGLLR